MLWFQSVVLQTQTLNATAVTASSPIWCVTTRLTVPTNRMSSTVVSGNWKFLEMGGGKFDFFFCDKYIQTECVTLLHHPTLLDHIIGLPGSCSFNMDENHWEETCQLSQNSDDDFDWMISQHSAPPPGGPYVDHSPGQFSLWSLI